MPRKKRNTPEAAPDAEAAVAVAEPTPEPAAESAAPTPPAEAQVAEAGHGKNWGDPYKAIFASKSRGFEMGENRRFKQRVFKFAEKPADEVIAALKESGFTYRAAEKAWTIQADAETRALSDRLAREFAGPAAGMSR